MLCSGCQKTCSWYWGETCHYPNQKTKNMLHNDIKLNEMVLAYFKKMSQVVEEKMPKGKDHIHTDGELNWINDASLDHLSESIVLHAASQTQKYRSLTKLELKLVASVIEDR